MRLIDADAVVAKLKKELETPCENKNQYIAKLIPKLIQNVIDYLEAQPTVEALPGMFYKNTD